MNPNPKNPEVQENVDAKVDVLGSTETAAEASQVVGDSTEEVRDLESDITTNKTTKAVSSLKTVINQASSTASE